MITAEGPQDPVLRSVRAAAGVLTRYHRGTLEGAERLPRGPALLVGNHGLFGLETPVFFWLVEQATGRLPRGLADRRVFGHPILKPLLERVGSRLATAHDAGRLLSEGNLVVCYPGGAREVFKDPDQNYQLRWERNCAFARLAIQAGVPVVPFAGLGVDDSWVNLGHLPAMKRALGRYALPIAVGLGPLPLPVRFRFVLGHPIAPPPDPSRAAQLKATVERAVVQLLDSRGEHALPPAPAPVVP
jgi:1-acyl-sn-glycerol-3-phosphate acyltransferase